MAITLQLTDGTTTINLVDTTGINVLRQNWSPQVAARRDDRRAGICPYEDVVETISFSVTGTSTSNLLSKIEALISLLDKVRDWQEDDEAAGVSIVYSPNGASNTSTALIVDLPDGWLNMPSEFEFGVGTAVFLQPVTIQLVRRGLWYQGFAEGSGGPTTEPAIQSITWTGAENLHSPIKVEISGGTGADASNLPLSGKGYFVWSTGVSQASGGPKFTVIDANSFNSTSGFSTNSAGANANGWGGAVMRATAASSAQKTLNFLATISGTGAVKRGRINVLARLKNTSASVTWTVNYTLATAGGLTTDSRSIIIGTDTTDPQIVNLGSIYSESMFGLSNFTFSATPSAASGSGHTLDIDAFCLFEVTQNAGAIYLEQINYFQGTHSIIIDPHIEDGQAGNVLAINGSNFIPMPYRGDLWISSKGVEQFNYCLFAVTPGDWRLQDGNINSGATDFAYTGELSIWETTLVPT